MKKLLFLASVTGLLLLSCSKKSDTPAKPNTQSASLMLTKVSREDAPILTLTYTGSQIATAQNTYYKDIIAYKSNGQIDTVLTYFTGVPGIYRIKKVKYGLNNKIQSVTSYSNGVQVAATTYTYDDTNRVKSIVIIDGASKYVYNYTYNSLGNQVSWEDNYTFNNQLMWVDKITASVFDDKPNPFVTLNNYEYFFCDNYQSEYNRLGVPATLSKHNPTQSVGQHIITNGKTEIGNVTYGLQYNAGGYPNVSNYLSLVGGSLSVTYKFDYIEK